MAKILNQSKLSATFVFPDYSQKSQTFQSTQSSVENMASSLKKVRSSSAYSIVTGGEATQTLMLNNTSELELENVVIQDILSGEITFVEGSVVINDEPKPLLNPFTSFTLENSILPQEIVIIRYKIRVNDNITDSNATILSHISYLADGIDQITEQSNATELSLIINTISIVKSADKQVAVSGEKIKYTNIISNNGNIKNTNLTFVDTLPSGISFVEGSVTINNTSMPDLNPNTEFAIQDLDVNESITITFEVVVD